jgi:hypothetical protein
MRFKQYYNKLDEAHSFSCAMLNLNKELSTQIQEFSRKNIKEKDLFMEQGGFSDRIHTTIKYGLESNNPKEVANLIKGFGPIEIELGNISKFSTNEEFDVLKIDVDGKKLRELNKLISEKMDNKDAFPKYSPHVTLAYIHKGRGNYLLANDTFKGKKDIINEVYFTNKKDEESFLPLI